MAYTFLSAFILLFLIIDPLGNIPIFANVLKKFSPATRLKIIIREHAIAFTILMGFMFAGQAFLNTLGLSSASLQIAGALILFLLAIRMIFPPLEINSEIPDHEPLIVPLAIPAVAGPSSAATVMLLVSQQPALIVDWILALTAAMICSLIILITADKLQKILGTSFVVALEKLMGLILVAISIEMMIRGIKSII